MGLQDRDYYRDWYKENHGHKKKAKRGFLRVLKRSKATSNEWHPVLLGLLTILIFAFVFGLLKLIALFLK